MYVCMYVCMYDVWVRAQTSKQIGSMANWSREQTSSQAVRKSLSHTVPRHFIYRMSWYTPDIVPELCCAHTSEFSTVP